MKTVAADETERRIFRVWAHSPDLDEGTLMEALPLYQTNPRMQRLLQDAIERRRAVIQGKPLDAVRFGKD